MTRSSTTVRLALKRRLVLQLRDVRHVTRPNQRKPRAVLEDEEVIMMQKRVVALQNLVTIIERGLFLM